MFGDILKKLREQSGISQRKLAEVLHVSQQTVGSWEGIPLCLVEL